MIKKYLHTILFFVLFASIAIAQESKQTIDGLSVYPNPVSNGKIFVTSKSSENKEIAIYDVLGKLIFQASVLGKEINISSLSPGVYIIKVRENEATATRKLIVK